MSLRPRTLAAPALALALTLAACGGDDGGAAAGEATTGDTATTVTTAAGSDAAVATVDANTASVDEIAAALEANGVANAERWAREVEEYRPYPTDDPTFAKLRGELSKYNPSSDTLEQIIASLTL